jgi:cobalt-zinc-cadmium efflux system membrane fusion protein
VLLGVMMLAGCGSPEAGEGASGQPQSHAEEGHEGAAVHLSAAQVAAAAIGTAVAGPAEIRETLTVYGSIAPNAERMREVAARFPGPIIGVNKKVGDTVKLGETLATVESNESLRTYAVTAPLAGVVTVRNANAGEQAADKSLFTVADLSTVWVELSLFPRDRASVRVGQQVLVRSVDAGLTATGQVVYVAPFGSSVSQTLTARVLLANAERRWAPGLYVSAEVVLSQKPAALTIRSEALQTLDGKTSVFVEDEPGEFVPHAVQLGRTDGEVAEVLAGIQAGQRYVTTNSFILKSQLGASSAGHED